MICSGYIAPEYLYKGEVSTKSDIYSLGVLILETTTIEESCHGNKPSAEQFIKKVTGNFLNNLNIKLYKLILQMIFCGISWGVIIPILFIGTWKLDRPAHRIRVPIIKRRLPPTNKKMHRNWTAMCWDRSADETFHRRNYRPSQWTTS